MCKKCFSLIFFIVLQMVPSYAQTTYSPRVKSKNNSYIIDKVQLTDNETIVTIKVPRQSFGGWVRFSSGTVIVPSDELDINIMRETIAEFPPTSFDPQLAGVYIQAVNNVKEIRGIMSERGFLIRNLGRAQLDSKYNVYGKGVDYYYFDLHFDRLPVGVTDFYIRELKKGGFEWVGIQINNPKPNIWSTGLKEPDLRRKIDGNNDGITGIYEGIDGKVKYKLACIKDGEAYKLIYMKSQYVFQQWREGDIKALLRPTSSAVLFKGDWYSLRRDRKNEALVNFDGRSMEIVVEDTKMHFVKMYPTATAPIGNSQNLRSSGTGFFLTNNGYIVTNNHVVEKAKSIRVSGINGDYTKSYIAKVEVVDSQNDLAIIKINDASFRGISSIPYAIKTNTASIGEDCFVLGYPLISTMGLDIKLTNGIISSRTGFQGNVSEYQISAPIQPGNSGGPLFDKDGNVIGVVCAKHTGAENAGYAVKASYLQNLVDLLPVSITLPQTNLLKGKALPKQVEYAAKTVCVIIVNGDINDVQ